MDLKEIVDQLEKCNFTDELGHKLENNVAFMELKKAAHLDRNQGTLTETKKEIDMFSTAVELGGKVYLLQFEEYKPASEIIKDLQEKML